MGEQTVPTGYMQLMKSVYSDHKCSHIATGICAFSNEDYSVINVDKITCNNIKFMWMHFIFL